MVKAGKENAGEKQNLTKITSHEVQKNESRPDDAMNVQSSEDLAEEEFFKEKIDDDIDDISLVQLTSQL